MKIKKYVSETTKEDFLKQEKTFDVICMQFSHMGEQVSRLEKSSENIIQHFPDEVDWSGLKALRNIIDHSYLKIDANQIWEFATSDVDAVENNLRKILSKRYGL